MVEAPLESKQGPIELNEHQLAKAQLLYKKYDKDGSGDIDRAELRHLLKELNLRLSDDIYETYVSKYWSIGDVDGSGTISWPEFLQFFKAVFAPVTMYGKALRVAAARGHLATVKDLVCRGCDANAGDGNGWSAVHHAAEYGQLEVIKLLQSIYGMDLEIDAGDNNGWTPLFNAVANGKIDVMRHLIKAGASLTATTDQGRTAVHIAAATGHVDALRVLIQEKAPLNATDRSGWTALHLACLHAHQPCIRVLLESTADRNIRDVTGHTYENCCSEETRKFVAEVLAVRGSRPKSPRSPRS